MSVLLFDLLTPGSVHDVLSIEAKVNKKRYENTIGTAGEILYQSQGHLFSVSKYKQMSQLFSAKNLYCAHTTYVKIRNNIQGRNSKNKDKQNAHNALLVKNLPPQKNTVFP